MSHDHSRHEPHSHDRHDAGDELSPKEKLLKLLEHWMKHNDVQGFFLNLPEYAFLPSLTEYSQNFPTYLQAETLQSLNNLKHIIGLQLPDSTDSALMSSLESQLEMLSDLNSWSKGQSTSTI